MELEGKKVIVLAEELYNEVELWYPYYRLREAGAEVTLVGSGSSDTYHSKVGLAVKVDKNAQEITHEDFDAIVIPGGYAPDRMRRYPVMVKLVKDMYQAGKVVATICHAGWMLASADILKGKKITSYMAIKDDLVHAGADWIDKEVVVDGNLVSSRQPDDLPVFMRTVIEAMTEQNKR